MTSPRDPYEVLGVPRTATTSQIRAAYVARARLAHPDVNDGRGVDTMRALNEAWEVLKDPARRQALDAAHHVAASAARGDGLEDGSGRPFWTGAMGRPPGRPHGPVLHFGIYDGWSIGEVARRDRGYLVWLRDRPEAEGIHDDIARLLDPAADEQVEPRRARRRWYPSR